MHRKILQGQTKARGGVLQVVNKEGGHRLESLKFLGHHQLTRQSQV